MIEAQTHMNDTPTELMAYDIVSQLQNTEPGHCARVDFLTGAEAVSICQYILHHHLNNVIAFHILMPNRDVTKTNELFITTDKAIEIRNRKQEPLCLFIPSDIVDAASSSIANSFALIDGRELYSHAFKKILAQLSPEFAAIVRNVFSRRRYMTGISEKQRLDFALALLKRMQTGDTTTPGLELWRVGLIADASESFLSRLNQNRDCASALSHPAKLGATPRERIQSIKVDATTAQELEQFFRGRPMNDVRSWSRELSTHPELTFDQWTFPDTEPSDIQAVTVKSFLNSKNVVEPYCRLQQPDGSGGSLIAHYGPKESIVVRWTTEPKKTSNLNRWRIAIVPSGSDAKFDEPIGERRVAGTRRTVTFNLDTEDEELPDGAFCIRIIPVGNDGRDILSEQGDPIYDDSDEFYLVQSGATTVIEPPRTIINTTPTLALGRLETIVEMKDTFVQESDEQWISKDLEYFRVRVNDRRVLNIGLSTLLLTLEKQIIDAPRTHCCFTLDIDEIRPVSYEQSVSYPLQFASSETWIPFWKARESFFKRLKQNEKRGYVEVAEWTPELSDSALRYAKAYRDLIDTLIKNCVDISEVREALSIDTLLIKNTGVRGSAEEAVVLLPTHPLRVAWFVSYTQLLLAWEEQLSEHIPLNKRKQSLDVRALQMLTPMNVPAFVYHAASSKTFTFFQNMRFFYGVALPPDISDPQRLFTDVAAILNIPLEQSDGGDMQPNQLTEHLKHFNALHPYIQTLVTTLVNPGRGNFFADALKEFLRTDGSDTDEQTHIPALQIAAYTEEEQKSTFQVFEAVRQQQLDVRFNRATDPFQPGLMLVARSMQQLEHSVPEAHLAVITDFTRPSIVAAATSDNDTSSFSLYGLINRFISQFITTDDGFLWRHRIVTGGKRKPEQHPAGPRYTDTLVDLQTSLLNAGGYLLNGSIGTHPMLEVHLDAKKRALLEELHTKTSWVITLDRYFTLDYYDSPYQQGLHDVARKYVLDYSPEFTEGLGHRMMVTTAWHEEIGSLLSRAMDDLGFSGIEQSVSQLLHHLKTVSGRLALDALESSSSASAAVGLGVVTAWLQRNKRLRKAVLLPVDIYPRLFSPNGTGKSERGERRCDMVLVSLQRNIVNATFIEVKWRRGRAPLEDLAQDMMLQMEGSAQAMKNRFFNKDRIDGALQRSYLANVLRFYFERSRRYQLFDPGEESAFLENLTKLEKAELVFRPTYEGYIVSLESEQHPPILMDNAKITLLTAKNFEDEPDLVPAQTSFLYRQSTGDIPRIADIPVDEYEDDTEEEVDTLKIPAIPTSDGQDTQELALDDVQNTQPTETTGDVEIPLGEAMAEPVLWTPGVKGSPHLFIIGIPGQGKSWTTTRLLTELGQQHVPSLVLDFHGQFADPNGPFVQRVHPHVLDASQGLPFSPFEYTKGDGQDSWKANATTVSEIFAYVAALGDMQKDVLYTAIRDAYRALEFEDANQAPVYPSLEDVMKRIEQNEQARHVGNVIARTRPLLEMDLFRPTEHATDFLSMIREGTVIDLHNLYSEMLQVAAGAFVLRKIYRDMFHWGTADRLRLAIVLDEAHRLAKDVTLPKLMKEGRKFGIAVIVASQGLGDFHPDVLSNTGSKIIFRMNYPESRKVSGFIRARQGQDLAARIEQLPVGSAYVQTPDMMYGTVVKMYPLED